MFSVSSVQFSCSYLRLLIFLLAILIPVCASSSPAFHMMYSAYKLKQVGDSIQTWCTPFPIWNQSVVPCPVLTVASTLAYRFLRRQVRWAGIPISWRIFQFVVIHIVKGFGVVNKAEVDVFLEPSCFFKGFGVVNKAKVDVFLEPSCFFCHPLDVGNLISSSSAFSKSSWNILKFSVHILKLHLKNFEHYFASMWNEYNCAVIWTFFGTAFLWDWNENWPFPDKGYFIMTINEIKLRFLNH